MSQYLLGHEGAEHERLRQQHEVWGPELISRLRAHGLSAGQAVLEVGCGPGFLLTDLGAVVGPDGLARGIERDPAAADRARASGCEVSTADLHDPIRDRYDWIVARWVFSFLPDPAATSAHLATALAPGGRLVVQDYDHDSMAMWPRDPAIDRVVEAYRAAYRDQGGDLWVGAKLPAILAAAGWTIEAVQPSLGAAFVDQPVWTWIERFLHLHLHAPVASGHLSEAGAGAFRAAWSRARAIPGALLVAPTLLTIVAQPPA